MIEISDKTILEYNVWALILRDYTFFFISCRLKKSYQHDKGVTVFVE
jgi:hypothetical protein